ncbi:MAG: hypothetical protein IJ890_06425 [Clostridia bacterium]|nr:hypothetical protein [Clostridia bacterium]
MNKEIKKKIMASVIVILLGIVILFSTLIFKNVFNENKIDYITGVSSGLIVVGMFIFIKTIYAISGADKGQEMVNKLQDERLIAINNEASGITFRITTVIAAIAGIVLYLLGLEKEGMILTAFVGIDTLIYLMSYFIISKRK